MVTPLTEDGKIDETSAVRLINFLLDNNTIPFVLGTTGEATSIPGTERDVLTQLLIKNRRDGYPAISGVMGLTFGETIRKANKYFKDGIDAVVITLPAYYKLTELQVFNVR